MPPRSLRRPNLWFIGSGLVELTTTNGSISALNSAGDIVVGQYDSVSGNQAHRWIEGGSFYGLSDSPGGGFYSNAEDVSDDGVVVVGEGNTDNGTEAFIGDEIAGIRTLTEELAARDFELPSDVTYFQWAYSISNDGTIIVGTTTVGGLDHGHMTELL